MKKMGVLVGLTAMMVVSGWPPRIGTESYFHLPNVIELLRGKCEDAGWNLHAETK